MIAGPAGPRARLPGGHGAADQSAIRLNNLALVLRQLSAQPLQSRASIATSTGLNKATVSSLVTELTASRLVREVGIPAGAVGRPGRTLELDGSGLAAIALEIDLEYVAGLARDSRAVTSTARSAHAAEPASPTTENRPCSTAFHARQPPFAPRLKTARRTFRPVVAGASCGQRGNRTPTAKGG